MKSTLETLALVLIIAIVCLIVIALLIPVLERLSDWSEKRIKKNFKKGGNQ